MPTTKSINPPTVPRLAIGAVVMRANKILLIQRKHPPHQHEWAIPGGKVKWGETLQQAAEREIYEETGICIKAYEPIYTFELIERDNQQKVIYHYVIVDLMCTYLSGEVSSHSDASDARWFSKHDITSEHINASTLHLIKNIIHFHVG